MATSLSQYRISHHSHRKGNPYDRFAFLAPLRSSLVPLGSSTECLHLKVMSRHAFPRLVCQEDVLFARTDMARARFGPKRPLSVSGCSPINVFASISQTSQTARGEHREGQ